MLNCLFYVTWYNFRKRNLQIGEAFLRKAFECCTFVNMIFPISLIFFPKKIINLAW
jgi:hypothetical protein